MQLFDEELAEVTDAEDGVRYVLQRNPQRAAEVAAGRQDKVRASEKFVTQQNAYLAEHPRASVAVAIGRVRKKIDRWRLSACFSVSSVERTLTWPRDEAGWQERSKLDGCYCLKTERSWPACA